MTTLNWPKVTGSPMDSPLSVLDEVTFPHSMMSLLGGMARQIVVERDSLLTVKKWAALRCFRSWIRVNWGDFFRWSSLMFCQQSNVNTSRCAAYRGRSVSRCESVNSNITSVQTGHWSTVNAAEWTANFFENIFCVIGFHNVPQRAHKYVHIILTLWYTFLSFPWLHKLLSSAWKPTCLDT